MGSANQGHSVTGWQAVFAGLQAGTAGTAAALVWMGLAAAWHRRSFWTAPNLMASTFYGDSAIRDGFGRSTLAGLALYFLTYAVLGAVFAWLIAGRVRGLARFMVAVLFGVAWYFTAFFLIARHWSPLVTLLHAEKPTLAAHIIYGGVLSRFERFLAVEPPPEPEPVLAEQP